MLNLIFFIYHAIHLGSQKKKPLWNNEVAYSWNTIFPWAEWISSEQWICLWARKVLRESHISIFKRNNKGNQKYCIQYIGFLKRVLSKGEAWGMKVVWQTAWITFFQKKYKKYTISKLMLIIDSPLTVTEVSGYKECKVSPIQYTNQTCTPFSTPCLITLEEWLLTSIIKRLQ